MALLAALALAVFVLPSRAQSPAVAHDPAAISGFPDTPFFVDNDRILDTIEPVRLGGEAFSHRLDAIRQTREPLGLVLSGGSARAFAHVGVLKALEEKGIRPDFIVANSMGAIVGLMYAAGFSPDTIESLVSGVSIGSLIDPVLPLAGGFINASRFAAFIRSIVGDIDLTDLPIPIMVIFEDLKSRRQVRVMRGNFADIMAAAFALPAVFEPVKIDDYLLIDGGMTNLVPTSAAYDYSRKVVVSVTMYDKAMDYTNPFTIINRAIDIGKTRSAVRELVDFRPIIIRNDVESISYMQFSRPQVIIARGYASAQGVLPQIQALVGPETLDPLLSEKNALYSVRVESAIDGFIKGNEAPNRSQNLVIPVFRLADEIAPDTSYDSGRRYAGIHALYRKGSLTTGVGFDYGLWDDADHAWGLILLASLRTQNGFFARAEGRLSGSWRSISSGLPFNPRNLDLAGQTGWVFGSDGLVFSAFAGCLSGIPFATGMPDWQAYAGFSARTHRVRPVSADASLRWFLDSRDNAGPEWSLRLASKAASPFGLRVRIAGRHSVFGMGMPFSPRDVFRGPIQDSTADALSESWLTGTAEAVWRAGILDFDAGEFLIVQDIEFAPFIDASLHGNASAIPSLPAGRAAPEMAAGLSTSASFSLMGLAPFDFSLSVAHSLSSPAWKISFNTGRLFR